MTVSNQRVVDEVNALRASIEKKLNYFQPGVSFGLEVIVDESTKYGFEVTTDGFEVNISDLVDSASFYVSLSANSFLMARNGDRTIATLLTAGEIKVRGDISQIDNFQNLLLS
jgi:hypothetical protein